MGEVPATATPLGAAEQVPIFLDAWASVFGDQPARSQAEWLLGGLLWNENAKGRAIIQHNWGNLSSTGKSGDFWRPPWFDQAKIDQMEGARQRRMQRLHDRMVRGEEPSAFRAWPDHATGARVWLSRLRDTFPGILRAAKRNSARALAKAVFRSRYCVSPACDSAANVEQRRLLRDEVRRAGLFATLASSGSRGGGVVVLVGLAALTGAVAWAAKTTR